MKTCPICLALSEPSQRFCTSCGNMFESRTESYIEDAIILSEAEKNEREPEPEAVLKPAFASAAFDSEFVRAEAIYAEKNISAAERFFAILFAVLVVPLGFVMGFAYTMGKNPWRRSFGKTLITLGAVLFILLICCFGLLFFKLPETIGTLELIRDFLASRAIVPR